MPPRPFFLPVSPADSLASHPHHIPGMALFLQLLPLLLSGTLGDPEPVLEGRPGDRVNFSCVGVSHPIRWAWAPSFPDCQGLSKGRRPILRASESGIPTVPPAQPFAGRLRALGPGLRRLELLLRAGDSGKFFCRGDRKNESHVVLHVLGDEADCRAPGPSHGSVYPQLPIPLLGAGLALGLGALGVLWWRRRRSTRPRCSHAPDLFCPPHIAPPDLRRTVNEEEPPLPGDLGQEPSLLYASLDHLALRGPRPLSAGAPADTSTTYAVIV